MDEVDRLTIHEYELLMKGAMLKRIDREYDIHLLAWKSFQAQGVKEHGKPVYKEFSKFYDYESRINTVLGTEKTEEKKDPIERYKDFLIMKKGR